MTWAMDPADVPDITVLSEQKRKARKQHKCCYCSKPIEPGTVYYHIAMTVDGRFESVNCHTLAAQCTAYDEEQL